MSERLFLYMLVMLNPFSQVLYVRDLMKEMSWRSFFVLYWRASILSFGVFLLFAVTGDFLFVQIFQVRLDSFRIFGGLIILLMAFRYFSEGAGGNLMFRSDPEELPSIISLPFMVGPGTIWVSILIGNGLPAIIGVAGIAVVLLVNLLIVTGVHFFIAELEGHSRGLVGKYFGILMRTNALFVGAIAVEMVLTGIEGMLGSVSR